MGQVHEFLGLTVGVVLNSMDNDERRAAYNLSLIHISPYYNKATQAGLIAHYGTVAKEAKAPIIMYSVASRTGCNIEPATVAELVKNVDNIVGCLLYTSYTRLL